MIGQKCSVTIFRGELRAGVKQKIEHRTMRLQDYFGRDTLRDQIGPAVFLLNARIDMLPDVGIGPAVEATRLKAGEEVSNHYVRRIVALFHRRPQLSCTGIKAK